MSLIDRAKQKILELNIEELRENGIFRPPELYKIRVTHPPLEFLGLKAKQEEIFSEELSGAVYIHYPFCPQRCGYCHFEIYPNQHSLMKELPDLLIKNIRLLKLKAESIHFGGGTPLFMPSNKLDEVLDTLFTHLNPPAGIEVTIESRPRTLTKEKLRLLKKYPINRINIGVQDFNDHVLSAIQRTDSGEDVLMAIDRAREAGFDNINIDLVYGCPDQTLEDWERNLRIAVEAKIPSITAYQLDIKEGRPVHTLFNANPDRFPGEKQNLLMHIMSIEFLTEMGYEHDPIDWFTKEKKYRYRHQYDKWKESKNLIGIGPDTYWFIHGFAGRNSSLEDYAKSIKQGTLPILKAQENNGVEDLVRKIIFGLKIQEGLDVAPFLVYEGDYIESILRPNIEKCERLGLIEKYLAHIKLTYIGKLFAEETCAQFFSRSTQSQIEKAGTHIYVH